MEFEPNIRELKQRLRWLEADPRPHIVLSDADLEKTDVRPELALAKAVLFSAHVIVVTQPCSVLDPVGSPPCTARRTWTDNHLKSSAAQLLAGRLDIPEYRDTFSLVPERVEEGAEEWESEEDWLPAVYHRAFHFGELYQRKALDVRFSDPLLLYSWLEGATEGVPPPFTVNLWLPELRGLSLDTLLRLRGDEREAFERFFRAVNQVVSNLSTLESSEQLKLLLQETDHEVREYERRLKETKKQFSRSLAAAAMGIAAIGCCVAIPHETAKLVSAFIGSYHAKDFVQNLFRHKDRVSDLRASDFYAAAVAGGVSRDTRE